MPAALGNYLGEQLIENGLRDGANEINLYRNKFYAPYNRPINPFRLGNPSIRDPNRWQPLALDTFVDQSGIPIKDGVPPFRSAEWRKVVPFALQQEDLKIPNRTLVNGGNVQIYDMLYRKNFGRGVFPVKKIHHPVSWLVHYFWQW